MHLELGTHVETMVDHMNTAPSAAPRSSIMTASEVLTWIAFRESKKMAWRDESVGRVIERLGPIIHEKADKKAHEKALELIGKAREWWHAGLDAIGDSNVRVAAEELKREAERRRKLEEATRALKDAILAKRIIAYGRPDDWPEPKAGHEPIDATLFMDDTIAVTLNDRVQQGTTVLRGGIRGGPGYTAVQFMTAEVLAVWPPLGADAPSAPSGKPLRASKPRGLDYAVSDAPLIREMEELLLTGRASNPWQAALIVSEKAIGSGSGLSKAKRLRDRFQSRPATGRD